MQRSIILPAVLLLAPAFASAQEGSSSSSSSSAKTWTSNIGVASVVMPTYTGSNRYRVRAVPVVQLEFKDRAYVGSSTGGVGGGFGVYVIRKSTLTWSTELSGAARRRESFGDGLAGMGTRSGGSFIGNNVSYRVGSLTAGANVAVGLGKDEGATGTVNATSDHRFGHRWIGSVSSGATFANKDNMAFDFGINSRQAGRRQALIAAGDSRLSVGDGRVYTPNGGLKQAQASTSLGFLISNRTTAMAFATGTRLGREAADSPLTRKRNGIMAGFGLVYGI
jgi:outer membrane protein